MAVNIIVEDGTGVELANAFESVDDTSVRLKNLGLWEFVNANPNDRAASLFRGTSLVMSRIEARISGTRRTKAQGLGLPRIGLYVEGQIFPANEIPEGVILACAYTSECEAAGIKSSRGDDCAIDGAKDLAESQVMRIIQWRAR